MDSNGQLQRMGPRFLFPLFRGHHQAFTFIELLVVVAIIGILLALGFPAFSKAKTAGQNIQCVANLRSLQQLMMSYASDHDDYYPVSWYPNGGPPNEEMWERCVSRYQFSQEKWLQLYRPFGGIYSEKGYFCPSRNGGKNWMDNISYGMNFYIGRGDKGFPTPLKRMQISRPSYIPLIADSLCNEIRRPDLMAGSLFQIQFRHSGRCNIVFCDGHGESLTQAEAVERWPNNNSFDPLAEQK